MILRESGWKTPHVRRYGFSNQLCIRLPVRLAWANRCLRSSMHRYDQLPGEATSILLGLMVQSSMLNVVSFCIWTPRMPETMGIHGKRSTVATSGVGDARSLLVAFAGDVPIHIGGAKEQGVVSFFSDKGAKEQGQVCHLVMVCQTFIQECHPGVSLRYATVPVALHMAISRRKFGNY